MSDLKLPGDVLEDAYITALLFTETDEDGVHLDVNWTAGDIDAAALVTLMHDARAFYLACADLIKDENLRGDNTAYPALDSVGERVEGAAVPDAAYAVQPPDKVHHVVRRRADRLVHDEDAVEGAIAQRT
jgi:hypothetical protein